jgi:predicted O-methyltransferase YrrM
MRGAARRAHARLFQRTQAPSDLALRIGALETAVGYLLDPASYTGTEGGVRYFNGQRSRADLFAAVLRAFDCESIIETGTYLGNTTKYMAETSSLPVHSCETNPVFFAIASKELAETTNVDLFLGDSRAFLADLVSRGVHRRRSFLYLDAHWNDDLPLVEEIEIIAGNWSEFVVMIDDFQVPHDDGYGFDDYGAGQRFTLKDFGAAFERNGLVPFFPRAPSREETGHLRGCVVLAKRGKLSEALAGLENALTQHDSPSRTA